jgi:hypothetical protein
MDDLKNLPLADTPAESSVAGQSVATDKPDGLNAGQTEATASAVEKVPDLDDQPLAGIHVLTEATQEKASAPSAAFPEPLQPPVFPEPEPPPKKGGRPPLPRDASGKIIRDASKPAPKLHNLRDAKGHFVPPPPPQADFSDLLGRAETATQTPPVWNGDIVDYSKLANVTFDVSTGVLCGIFGPEWKPESEEEKKSVVEPLAAYYRSKEIKDLPPGMMVVIVVAAYSARRIPKPGTSAKLKLCWLWFKSKFSRKKS